MGSTPTPKKRAKHEITPPGTGAMDGSQAAANGDDPARKLVGNDLAQLMSLGLDLTARALPLLHPFETTDHQHEQQKAVVKAVEHISTCTDDACRALARPGAIAGVLTEDELNFLARVYRGPVLLTGHRLPDTKVLSSEIVTRLRPWATPDQLTAARNQIANAARDQCRTAAGIALES